MTGLGSVETSRQEAGGRQPGALDAPERSRIKAFFERHIVAVFVTPALVFIVGMMAFPLGYTLYLSVHSWFGSLNAAPQPVGLGNYRELLTSDPRFWPAAGRTFLFTGVGVGVQTVLGVALAVFLHRQFKLRNLVRTAVLMPMIATPVAVALIWRLMFQPQLGLLNDLLSMVGLPALGWVSDPRLALLCLILVDVWEWTPLIALITLAGLSALPEEPMEAAAVDGATPWKRFWLVTLPMVRPVVVVAVVFRLIEALKTFDPILVITQGGPGFVTETLNIYAYNAAFQYQQLGYASALLVIYFILILVAAGSLLRFRRSKD